MALLDASAMVHVNSDQLLESSQHCFNLPFRRTAIPQEPLSSMQCWYQQTLCIPDAQETA